MVVAVEEAVVVVEPHKGPHMVGAVEEDRFRCLHLLALQQQLVVVQHQLGACRRCHRCWPSSFVRLGLGLHHQPHPLPLLRSRQLLVERHRLELRNRHYPCLVQHPCLVLHPCRHLCQDLCRHLCRHRMHPYPYPCPCLCQGHRQHPCLECRPCLRLQHPYQEQHPYLVRHPCLELHPYLELLLPCLV